MLNKIIVPADADAKLKARVKNARRAALHLMAYEMSSWNFGAGPLASVRRQTPAQLITGPAFHWLIRNLPDDLILPGNAPMRWGAVVQAMAIGINPGDGVSLRGAGKALAEAAYSEVRFARLLASSGDTLRDQIVLLARYMNRKHVRFNWSDLGELVLIEGLNEERAGALRFRLARGYYISHGEKQIVTAA